MLPTPTTFKAGQLVKLKQDWPFGYVAYAYMEPRRGWPPEFMVYPSMVGVYIKYVSDERMPDDMDSIMNTIDRMDAAYYPVDVILFKDCLVELPTDVIELVEF